MVAHTDVALQRKDDPGLLFPRRAPAIQDIGAWPDAQRMAFYLAGRAPHTSVETTPLLDLLSCYGYGVRSEVTLCEQQRVIIAFQTRFRPTLWSGVADAETQTIAETLLKKYGQG